MRCSMVEILTFEQALAKSSHTKRNLLLGNGFSIACDSTIFNYQSLYTEAVSIIQERMPEVYELFGIIATKDFEAIIRILEHGKSVLPIYLPHEVDTYNKMLNHAMQLRELLISTIAQNHPESPASISDTKFSACRRFLKNFIGSKEGGRVYTLNYDLLLYWSILHTEMNEEDSVKLYINDGFGKEEQNYDYIIWKNDDHSRDQRVFYLHGAVHLFERESELEKYTWTNNGQKLIDQAREALKSSKFPLFVAEGRSDEKLKKIKQHPYLNHSYKSFLATTKEDKKKKTAQKKSLFLFGHSLSDNDDHVIKTIAKGTLSSLYVSIYGDKESESNKWIIKKALSLKNLRKENFPLEVSFYDAQSAEVWG